MMTTNMARKRLNRPPAPHSHAGLWLDRYLPEWPGDSSKKGETFTQHIGHACQLKPPPVYQAAYERWRGYAVEQAARQSAACWAGKVDGRLFLGLGGASPLEAAISLHHTYGVPKLPGSALKGLARAYAEAASIDPGLAETLFGRETKGEGEDWDGGDAGYLVFHDAWWIPDGPPLAQEIVTVHHAEYYAQTQTEATDFDSPTPNAQIAIRGSFLFAVEGLEGWGREGLRWLQAGLRNWGAGAKTAAGYGYFDEDAGKQKELAGLVNQARRQGMSGEDLLLADIQALQQDKALADALSKRWKTTRETFEKHCPGIADVALYELLESCHGEKLRSWEAADKNTNSHKAFKRWKALAGDTPV
jgi:CRISPR-associated protein Cmr6